jgi:hypothetical protein
VTRPILLMFLVLPLVARAQTAVNGDNACASCHSRAKTQPYTSMGQALERVEECKVLIDRPVLTVTVGEYSYRIERKGNQSEYSVTDGTRTITAPIRWAMGASSSIGQTYILEKDGELYESRVSYYRELKTLAPTLGSQNSAPASLREALGRVMTREDKLSCFGCHSTNAVSGHQLTLDKLRQECSAFTVTKAATHTYWPSFSSVRARQRRSQSRWQAGWLQKRSQIFADSVIGRGRKSLCSRISELEMSVFNPIAWPGASATTQTIRESVASPVTIRTAN